VAFKNNNKALSLFQTITTCDYQNRKAALNFSGSDLPSRNANRRQGATS